MRIFPIGTKKKQFVNNTNINAQLQSNIETEINKFYRIVPLKEESFDPPNKTKIKNKKIKKTKKLKTKN